MHLKYTFEIMELSDQIIAVPIGDNVQAFRGVIKLNETSAFIFELLKEDITEDIIVDKLEMEYNAPKELLIHDVRRYIQEFNERGLLIT